MRLPSVTVLLALVLATLCVGAEKKRKLPKFGQVEILEIAARRGDGKVTVDGRVRNSGARAVDRSPAWLGGSEASARQTHAQAVVDASRHHLGNAAHHLVCIHADIRRAAVHPSRCASRRQTSANFSLTSAPPSGIFRAVSLVRQWGKPWSAVHIG